MNRNISPEEYYRSGNKRVALSADPNLVAVRFASNGRDPAAKLSGRAARFLRNAIPEAFIANHGVQILRAPNLDAEGGQALLPLDRDDRVDFAAPLRRIEGQESHVVVVLPEVLARFREDLQRGDIERILEEYRAYIIKALPALGNSYLIRAGDGFGPEGPIALANRLVDDGYALKASPNIVKRIENRLASTDMNTNIAVRNLFNELPVKRDPEYGAEQWHLDVAKVREAWQTTKGRGVIVAVLDDGIAVEHPEFAGRVVGERDFATGGASAEPTSAADNHGTACAGVAVAGGVKAFGVAPEAGLLAVRTPIWLGTSEEVDMFLWCASEGASVVSCSWGPAQPHALPDMISEALDFLANRARDRKGVVVLFAAGNESEDMSTDGYAASEHVLAIAASTDAEQQAWYSDFGPDIDLCAPSNGGTKAIFTTDRPGPAGYNAGSSDDGDPDGDYTNSFGGTSSATPLVAGVAALVLAANPALHAREVRDVLQSTADKIGDPSDYTNGHSIRFGYGRVNAEAAVTEALHRIQSGNDSGDGASVTIDTPPSINRNGPPPEFTVLTSYPFWAVEVATDPLLFDATTHGFRRSEANFYSSFNDEGVETGDRYTLSDRAWKLLRDGEILAYRAIASTSASGVDATFSTLDQDAASAKRIQITNSEPVGGAGGSSITFPSGAMFRVVTQPNDGEDYADPVANGLIPLIDTQGRLDEQLSENFTLSELAAKSGRYRYARVSVELVEGLQAIRTAAGAPLRVRSAYRPPALNSSVGGAKKSQHLAGRSVDISIRGLTPLEVAELAIEYLGGEIGLGLGRTTTHIDLRGSLTTWVYEGAELSEQEFDEWARREAQLRGGLQGERPELTHRDWPSVEGPAEWTISEDPPGFLITLGHNGFVALEFATDPKLFWPSSTGQKRTKKTFAATWEYGLRQVGRSLTVTIHPQMCLWQRLAGASRIYYRAVTAANDDGSWPEFESSLSLDELKLAPSLKIQRAERGATWESDASHRRRVEQRWKK